MWITPAAQVIGLVLVFFGWIITNWQNNRRETRKEGRSACDAIKKYILEITVKGKKYYLERDGEISFEIKSELELLEIELGRIPFFGIGQNSTLMKCFISFSDALTDEDFEQKDAPKLASTDPKIQRIMRKRNSLLREVERQFKLQFL